MKKMFIAAALFVAACGMVNAATSEMILNEFAVVNSTVDGTYVGNATPTMMNGNPVSGSLQRPYSGTFTISNGILSGSFNVGPHRFSINSEEEITGVGTYEVTGRIEMLITGDTYPFTGQISVTEVDGTNLQFSCTAETVDGKTSEFSFTTK